MKIFSFNENRIASDYMARHFEALVAQAKSWGLSQQSAEDMTMDVYVSIRKRERNNEGFSMDGSTHTDVMTVKGFILCLMKAYSKNKKYHSYNDREVYCDPLMADLDDGEVVSSAQKQFMYAESDDYDEMEKIEDSLINMREEIDYVINFTDKFSVRAIIENWKEIAYGKVNKNILKPLTQMLQENDEFGESFKRVVKFYLEEPLQYKEIIASM